MSHILLSLPLILFSLTILQLSITATVAKDSINLITNPRRCESDAECPKSEYCKNDINPRCRPRVVQGKKCDDINPFVCAADNTACFDKNESGYPRCHKKLSLGEPCPFFAYKTPCASGTVCAPSDRCRRSNNGFKAPCDSIFICGNLNTLFCDSKTKRCEKRKPAGASCYKFSEEFECKGYCGDVKNDKDSQVCMPTRKLSQSCDSNEQCAGNTFPARSPKNVLCNHGHCVREGNMLRKLGAKCSLQKDPCDERRALKCAWDSVGKKSVCMQVGAGTSNFCTPNNRFSRCPPLSVPRECRRTLVDGTSFSNFYQCQRKIETLPRGSRCARNSYTKCQKGTSCEVVQGVRMFSFRGQPRPTTFCVVVQRAGGFCSNTLRSKCGDGFACKNGKCVVGEMKRIRLEKYIGLFGECEGEKLPCLPGLVCQPSDRFRLAPSDVPDRCVPPTVVVKKGGACFEVMSKSRVCAKGLFCSVNSNGKGLLRCRTKLYDEKM